MKIYGVFVIVLLAVLSQGDCRVSHALEIRALTGNSLPDTTALLFPGGNPVISLATLLIEIARGTDIRQSVLIPAFNALLGGNIADLPDLLTLVLNIENTLANPNTGFAGVKSSTVLLTLLSLFNFTDIAGLPGFANFLGNIVKILINPNTGIAGVSPPDLLPTLFSFFTIIFVMPVLLNVFTTLFSGGSLFGLPDSGNLALNLLNQIFGASGGVTAV